LKGLGEGLKSLSSLQKMDLNFRGCTKFKDKGMEDLSEGIAGLDSLKSISLNFSECEMEDWGLFYLSDAFKKLEFLESIILSCYKCKWITNEVLIRFGADLQELDLLKTVEMSFKSCPRIWEKGVKHMKNFLEDKLGFGLEIYIE